MLRARSEQSLLSERNNRSRKEGRAIRLAVISQNEAQRKNWTELAKNKKIRLIAFQHCNPRELIDFDIVILDRESEHFDEDADKLSSLSCYRACISRSKVDDPRFSSTWQKPLTLDVLLSLIQDCKNPTKSAPPPQEETENAVQKVASPDAESVLGETTPSVPTVIAPVKQEDTAILQTPQPPQEEQDVDEQEKVQDPISEEHSDDAEKLGHNLLNNDRITDTLLQIVADHYSGVGEQAYYEQIGLGTFRQPTEHAVRKPILVVEDTPPHRTDFTAQFVDDALNVYRAKKLRKKHLSAKDIEMKMREMIRHDATQTRAKGFNAEEVISELAQKDLLIDADTNEEARIRESETQKNEIEEQRREAIFDEQKPMHSKPDRVQPPPPSLSPLDMSPAELKKRLSKNLSPEQIEKLRRLGVRID